jgi:Skp family chaperone for outer membrane proteins
VKFSVDPSISWGDIVMTAGLVFSGVIAFTAVSEGVALNAVAINVVERDVATLTVEHHQRLQQERADRETLRQEMREDLRAISDKLDRLIEGGLRE